METTHSKSCTKNKRAGQIKNIDLTKQLIVETKHVFSSILGHCNSQISILSSAPIFPVTLDLS